MLDFKSIQLFLIIFFSFTTTISFAQKPTIEWQKTYGGSINDRAKSIIQTRDGGYAIAGNSDSNDFDLTSNYGTNDFWIIKINNTGDIQWKKTLGGSGNDNLAQIIETPEGGFLCIGFTDSSDGDITNAQGMTDLWVSKLDFAGNVIWKKNYGGSYMDWGNSICLCNDGNYIVAGTVGSPDKDVSDYKGSVDFWVIKIDIGGNIIWKKIFGGTGPDYLTHIIKTSDGGYAMTGYSSSTNEDFLYNRGGQDIWLVKINSEGTLQWTNSFGGSLDDISRSLLEDRQGNFVIVGESYSFDLDASENHNGYWTRDYIAIKTNNLGQKIWSRCYGGNSEEYARNIAQTTDGEYVLIGESYSVNGDPTENHGSADFWLIKINPVNGDIRWEKNIGGSYHDDATGVVATFDNGYLLTGSVTSYDGDVTQNRGHDDIWVVKLKSNECHHALSLNIDIPLGNAEFNALNNIYSTSKIFSNNTTVIYTSGNSIELFPGFKIEEGVKFEAKIGNCN
jgi:hypothetical protein